jgi:hypothetical protein
MKRLEVVLRTVVEVNEKNERQAPYYEVEVVEDLWDPNNKRKMCFGDFQQALQAYLNHLDG